MKKLSNFFLFSVLAIFLATGSVYAMSVGVIGGSDGTSTTDGSGNVANDLAALSIFSQVDALAVSVSYTTIASYDAILFYTSYGTSVPMPIANKLADYVDAGGGLVTGAFLFQNFVNVLGRLRSDGYLPFEHQSIDSYGSTSMNWYDSTHPIMQGPLTVSSVSGYFHDDVTLNSDATLIATWADGEPFVAIDDGSGVVSINLLPNDYWSTKPSGDYMELFGNALYYVGNPVPVPATMLLLGSGLVGLAGFRRKFKK